MKEELKNDIRIQWEGFLNSYAQVFFSVHPWLALLLLAVSFIDVYAGLSAVLSVLTANLAARSIGLNSWSISKGYYGFNSLLVGLGFGITFQPGLAFFMLVVAAALITFFFSVALQGVFYKYGLPFLSLPFLFGFWMIMLASGEFTALGLSIRGIYTHNELYSLGGKWLIDCVEWFDGLITLQSVRTYLLSLGAIFFQYNLLAGILIALGILVSSRIAFTLSILGFALAWLFYRVTGADINQLGYSYIGFNYILTSIALGGFFIIPSRWSYFWLFWLLPLVIVVTVSLHKLFSLFLLGVYALPFNVVVLTFLYVLKLRANPGKFLIVTEVQHFNPERNLYHRHIHTGRFYSPTYLPVSLPIMGEWSVSQGWNGTYTHKGEWAHAIDFMMKGNDGKEFRGSGDNLHDYHCYGKPVVTPADGTVANLTDGIPDNVIGEDNTRFNWGNSIVIRHSEHLYSQVSHLKPGSLKVSKGDPVKRGDILGLCGNSGRSPYPHLHFQLQPTPHIGSKTLPYPISEYLMDKNGQLELKTHSTPSQGDRITAIRNHPLLEKAFQFLPGKELTFEVTGKGPAWLKGTHAWEIKADEYNNNYIECTRTGAVAYFYNNGNIHYFTNFTGSRKSLLYYFYLAFYKVLTCFNKGVTVNDHLPPDQIFQGMPLILQDFIAPFHIFLKARYELTYIEMADDFYTASAKLKAVVRKTKGDEMQFSITLSRLTVSEFKCQYKELDITAVCTDQ